MKGNLYPIFLSLRPLQWLKNTALFAAILFSRDLFKPEFFWPVFWAFWLMNILSSAMYLINDSVDRQRDKIHVYKKSRPIASGLLSPQLAVIIATILTAVGLFLSFKLSYYFFSVALAFVIVQLLYNLVLKFTILLDIVTIAITFILRVFAGSFVVVVPLSSWLILTTIMLSLLLAAGKRRAELTLLTHHLAGKHRETLYQYPERFLDGITFMMGAACLITYSLFTFNELELHNKAFVFSFLPRTLAYPKWLMLTIPLVVYGILRYLFLIFEGTGEDSPEKTLVKDFPLLATILLWLGSVVFIIYVLGAG